MSQKGEHWQGTRMKRLLLDTNIYGEMIVDENLDKIKEGLKQGSLIIFGSKIIRKELRATPKKIKVSGSNLRIDLLSLYDLITAERTLDVEKETENLADDYYLAYRTFGGAQGKEEMATDFLIVASATLKEMDIVVSNDESTMKSKDAFSAYQLVNSIKKLRNPNFIDYNQFKGLLR